NKSHLTKSPTAPTARAIFSPNCDRARGPNCKTSTPLPANVPLYKGNQQRSASPPPL
uniref:Uncharacterized protein n=1 Tax=Aegilops tauschii subsp. strangulata TaxID=200361 RepID=A0A453B5A7_AEGTS